MCDHHHEGEAKIQIRQCQHGTVFLSVGSTTLSLSERELAKLFFALKQCVQVKDEAKPIPRAWPQGDRGLHWN